MCSEKRLEPRNQTPSCECFLLRYSSVCSFVQTFDTSGYVLDDATVLGRGKTAVVHRCMQQLTGRHFAVKVINTADPGAMQGDGDYSPSAIAEAAITEACR